MSCHVMFCHVMSCHLLTLDEDGDVHLALTLHVVHFVMSCHVLSYHVMSPADFR
jgi:hypothetical protein